MYDIFYISNNITNTVELTKLKAKIPILKYATDFNSAQTKSMTEFFWVVWDDIIINDDFDFSYTPKSQCVHTFLNGKTRDGVFLVPSNGTYSKNEIECRFFINRLDVDIAASVPIPYDRFVVNTYKDYLYAVKNTKTNLFWITNDLTKDAYRIPSDFYISYHEKFSQTQHHLFFDSIDGSKIPNIWLINKDTTITYEDMSNDMLHDYETNYGLNPKRYDVVFISYHEPNAELNYKKLLKIVPDAKRVDGVTGIHQAHIAAALLCNTDMFWVVDGDAEIVDGFDFSYRVPKWDNDVVHVWRAQNPINELVYGYGGVKLFPRDLTINMDTSKPDMTTSISKKFKAIPEISNVTAFNTDPYNTWKSAFRECAKLSSKIIDRQNNEETSKRLNIWCTVGNDKKYGNYATAGARQGAVYGYANRDNMENIKLINNFEWLMEQFKNANI